MEITQAAEAFIELERSVRAALETNSNIHRGSGHNSLVSTHLYEQAREIVLASLVIENMEEDVDQFLEVLGDIARQTGSGQENPFAPTHEGAPLAARTEVQRRMNEFARAAAKRVYLI